MGTLYTFSAPGPPEEATYPQATPPWETMLFLRELPPCSHSGFKFTVPTDIYALNPEVLSCVLLLARYLF
jgi:hypothetical protein